jgi:hypothetical protein
MSFQHDAHRVHAKVAKTLEPICVVLPLTRERRVNRRQTAISGSPAPACNWSTSTPSSVMNVGNISICKYFVAGDAVATDSVTDNGGARVVDTALVPIFFGSAWSGAVPSIGTVMNAIRRILASPYLSQMDQYFFHNLTLSQPIQAIANPSMPTYKDDDAGNLVWDLIDSNVFPEPDEAGGRNVYMVFYPPGTTIDTADRCGAHSVYSDYDFPFDIDYAWVGYAEFNQTNGKTLDNITKTFSHELIEIISDPEPDGDSDEGWQMSRSINGGTEIGDACNNTADRVTGVLVNGYWSERHKACIIPRQHRWLSVTSEVSTLSQEEAANGWVELNTLCHRGRYTWRVRIKRQEMTFRASAHGFVNPVFSWKLVDGGGGPTSISDGFSGALWLNVYVWYTDLLGTHNTTQFVRVDVRASGGNLTVRNIDPAVGNFSVEVQAIATEATSVPDAPETSSYDASDGFEGRTFAYDAPYDEETRSCRHRFEREWMVALPPLIPPHLGPDDRRWGWVDRLPEHVAGERREFVVTAAAMAAALQEAAPERAAEVREAAAGLGQVPAAMLSPQRLQMGRLVKPRGQAFGLS